MITGTVIHDSLHGDKSKFGLKMFAVILMKHSWELDHGIL